MIIRDREIRRLLHKGSKYNKKVWIFQNPDLDPPTARFGKIHPNLEASGNLLGPFVVKNLFFHLSRYNKGINLITYQAFFLKRGVQIMISVYFSMLSHS